MKRFIKYSTGISCFLCAALSIFMPFSVNALAEETARLNKPENVFQSKLCDDKTQKIEDLIKNELAKEIEKLLPEIRQKISESLKNPTLILAASMIFQSLKNYQKALLKWK